MFENIRIGYVFLLLAAVWLLQLFLALLQSRRFNKRISELRRSGSRTSVGLAGSTWRRKVYAVIVVDDERYIRRAEKLAGFTVFADSKPVEGVEGLHISRLEGEPVEGVSPKVWLAMRNAAQYILDADRAKEEEQNVKAREDADQEAL